MKPKSERKRSCSTKDILAADPLDYARALQAYYESASKGPNPPHATYVLKGALLPSPPKASQGHDSMDVDTQGGTQESTDSELKVNGSQGEGTSEASEALLLVGEEKLEGEYYEPVCWSAPRLYLFHLWLAEKSEVGLAQTLTLTRAFVVVAASKARFREITTCHIYSLQAGALKDPALLTSVEHELHTVKKYVQTWEETERGAQLGVLANLNIQDRYVSITMAASVESFCLRE